MADTTIILFSSALIFSFFLTSSTAVDTITANQIIRDDGNGTIESATGDFEMGFFSPGSSKNRYLGIWYKKIATGTVIWVANRETPITDTSGVLRVNLNGVLVLKDGTNSIIWSSNSSGSAMKPVAQLLDTGNLVIRNGNDTYPDDYLWQSFDHPGDNGLAGTKLGWDLGKGLNRLFTSWKSPDDPSPGNYSSGVDRDGYPQHVLWNGSAIRFRFGPWNGIQFGGKSYMMQNPIFTLDFVFDQNEIYYKSELRNSSIAMRMMLNPYGQLQILVWTDPTQGWVVYLNTPTDNCDNYGLCGAFGTCNITNSKLGFNACGCLEGFEPRYPEKWKVGDWTSGCVRKTKLDCGSGDMFMKFPNLKLPDTRHSWFDPKMSLDECERVCLNNCSCTAYANMDIREGGSGCLLWFDDLMDMRVFIGNDQCLYVRMAAGKPGTIRSSRAKKPVSIIVIAVSVVLVVILSLILIIVFKKRKPPIKGKLSFSLSNESTIKSEKEDLQLPLFDFVTIANATNNFSNNNKLGEGGFGPVYMGILDGGQEIAVKRLSKTSNQGLDEFKNEVSCIAKLQHRNLVRLLGCNFEEGEMLLIYEYMPNKSLDFFIFDKELSKSLDWPKRFNIINGITKGLLYLHQDSRLRIIHRDLKAGNILLDCEMNPKVSDFGTARSFGGNESEANTSRVVGTFGYMSPEYALDGTFSVKSDVYSFGVLVLEIVSGKKMRGFYHADPNLNLLGHAWRLRKEGKLLDLIDEAIQESCNQSEVFRVIQIGLLCVQPYPEDRPSMSSVNHMLSSEIEMPEPIQPGFFTGRKLPETNSSSPLILDISGVFDTSSL